MKVIGAVSFLSQNKTTMNTQRKNGKLLDEVRRKWAIDWLRSKNTPCRVVGATAISIALEAGVAHSDDPSALLVASDPITVNDAAPALLLGSAARKNIPARGCRFTTSEFVSDLGGSFPVAIIGDPSAAMFYPAPSRVASIIADPSCV